MSLSNLPCTFCTFCTFSTKPVLFLSSLYLFCLACVFLSQISLKKRHNPLFPFPSSVSGATFILYYSFSIHFRDHLVIILNVTVGFPSLFYLFPFYLPCSFYFVHFRLACTLLVPCLYLKLVLPPHFT